LPPSRNKRVRSGIAAIRLLLRKNLLQEAAVQLQQLHQSDASNMEIALLQAELLTLAGDHDRSCQLLKQVLAKHPGLIPALTLFARAHTAAQRHLDAMKSLQLAHELAPDDHNIARQLAETLTVLRRPADAATIMTPVARKSKSPADLAQLAALHDKAGKLNECLTTYDLIKPSSADLMVLKAGALLIHGRRDDAHALVADTLNSEPGNTSLRLFIAKNFASDFNQARQAEEIEAIQASSGYTGLTPEDRARLNFALGLTHERTGNFTKAFLAIEEANRQIAPDDLAKDQQLEKVALGIGEHFTKARMAQLAPAGHTSERPVFVTGLPRSGTTLVEQIIASHPDATTLGELELIPSLKQSLVSLQSRDINRCAEAWLAAVPDNKAGHARVVDKSISTALHTGLAMLMFPKARFIFVKRHPMDVCWSAYREMFGTNALTFTCNLQALVRRIQFTDHIMSIWAGRFPDRILTLKYENLVADSEIHTRNIIAHTGMDWDDECLNFHNSGTVVRTASMAQVRKPVYNSSVGKWTGYRQHLQPITSALAELITEYEKDL